MNVFLRVDVRRVGLLLLLVGSSFVSSAGVRVSAQAPPLRWDGLFELVSGRYDYPPPWTGTLYPADSASHASRHAISGDGRYVVFASDATTLGSPMPAVYRRDRRTGELEQILGFRGRDVAISADGSHSALQVCEPWLRPDDAPICDVYALELDSWRWTPLSATADGTLGDDESSAPVLSGNGRFVVFVTRATNISGGPAGVRQVVLRDRDADGNGTLDDPGTVVLETISVGEASGSDAGDADSDTAEVSDDGRFVAFRSRAGNLVPGDTNGTWDVFLRDRQTAVTRRLNVGPEGQQSTSAIESAQLSMSADGRYVAFASEDGQLAASAIADTNGVLDVFVYDGQSSSLSRIDIGWGPPNGVPGNGPTLWPTLSADGRYVSLQSAATNVEVPPSAGTTQVYVIDRAEPLVTRISVTRAGQDPDADSLRPGIAADGSVVLFWSQATTLAGVSAAGIEQLYAAVHFEIRPSEQLVPGGGGSATYTVVTQQHTLWWPEWDWNETWFGPTQNAYGIGNGTFTFEAREVNPSPVRRSSVVHVGQASVTFTQDVGLSLTSILPASGPMSGGTAVTLRGTGFEPGMIVAIGQMVAVEFVDSTTLVAVTAPYDQRGPVPVSIATPDGRAVWIDGGFSYLDSTPPQVWGWAEGTEGQNGWYVGNVTVHWNAWDPESGVTSTPCADVVVATDTAGTTYSCSATSEGGTGLGSVTVKRDATPPTATIVTPVFTMYDTGAVVVPSFTCADATSGPAACAGSTNGDPLDTLTPGYHTFSVTVTDQAGNAGYASVDYAIASNVCAYPMPDLRGWWRFERDTRQWMNNTTTNATRVGLASDVFVDGPVGQAYQFEGSDGYLATSFSPTWWSDEKFAIGAWVKPSADTLGTILRNRNGYAVARLANGSIAWAFRTFDVPGLAYTDTGVKLPLNVWSHVVVMLEDTTVRTYLNGRLAHTATNIGDVYNMATLYGITIGGADDRPDYFKGALDEVQVFDHGLDAQGIGQLFLAGAAGACVHKRTAFQITEPIPAAYGDATFAIDARLVDEHELPVAGRSVKIESQVSSWPYGTYTTNLTTDADGRVHWDVALRGAPRNLYEHFVFLTFSGDADYTRVFATPDVLVGKGTPLITWPAPAPISFGTFLSDAQLNATANVAGSFSYSPAWGAGLPAGSQSLSVTFTPNDTTNYNTASATVPLTVNRATPVVTVTGGIFVYDGTPHAATGTVKNQWNAVIGTPTVTYNGAPEPPVGVGTYDVVATYEGSANYAPASATTTLMVTKATPTVSVTGGTFVYDTQPHAAIGTVTGVGGAALGSLTFSYNGSAQPPVDAGVYNVIGTFEGDGTYTTATGTATITVTKATAALSWPAPPAIVYGTALGAAQLAATSAVPGTFAYEPGAGTRLNAGMGQALTATFTPADNANYADGSVSTTIDVAQATPDILVFTGARTYNGSPHAAGYTIRGIDMEDLTPAVVSYNGSTENPTNAGTYDVVVRYEGSANYRAASAAATLTINKADPTLAWATPAAITYGTPLGAAQFMATASVAGTFAYSAPTGTILGAGSHTLSATFVPDDPVNHSGGTVAVTLAVAKATPSVNIQPSLFTYDGQAHPAPASVTGAGGVLLEPLTITYNGSPDAPVNAGTYEAAVTFAGNSNYATASGNATITISKAAAVLSWSAPAAIVYGTPLGAAQLNASTNVAGTFLYSPPVGSRLSVGAGHVLNATFTPADPANYNGGAASTTITVTPAPLSVVADNAVKPFGAPVAPFTATFYGLASGESPANLAGVLSFATNATQASPVGTYPIVPGGLTSPNYAVTFVSGTLAVVKGAASVSVSITPEPSGAEMPMTLTATVAAAPPAAGNPAGTVRFFDGTTLLGTAAISGGLATLVTAGLDPGVRTIEARYDGDGSFETGSASSSHVVNTASFTPVLAISSSRNPSSTGQTVTFTANVTMPSGPVSGIVQFYDGATLIGSATIASGRATLATAALANGSHAITARFPGSASAPPSTSPVFVQAVSSSSWKNRATTTSVAASANPSPLGDAVVFTARVTGSSVPSGRVLFMVDGTVVGDPAGVPVTPVSGTSAQAALSVPGLMHGRHTVTTTYLGSSTFKGSTGLLTQTVN